METPGEEDGLVRLIIVRKSSPIEGIRRYVGENVDFLTHAKADQGVGRGRGRPPHPAIQSTSLLSRAPSGECSAPRQPDTIQHQNVQHQNWIRPSN